jgi:aryl-alcohol dehydrogenase-like predicted oxidoreductase
VSPCRRLGLGTAQWGMTYGIANRTGQLTTDEVRKILQLGRKHGILLLDTAYAYGEAESVVGDLSDEHACESQIVTKTVPLRAEYISDSAVSAVMAAFARSLERLRCRRVYALLAHHANDLLAAGGDRLWDAMRVAQVQGRAAKLGVSVYDPGQLEAVLSRYPIEIVQLPFNVYDQRFSRTGLLERLEHANVEVHARSAFLQGLLLMPVDDLPDHFLPISDHHASFHAHLRELGVSPLGACLRFCLAQGGIDKIIVGCDSVDHLAAAVEAAESSDPHELRFKDYALEDLCFIDPSRWPCQSKIVGSGCRR